MGGGRFSPEAWSPRHIHRVDISQRLAQARICTRGPFGKPRAARSSSVIRTRVCTDTSSRAKVASYRSRPNERRASRTAGWARPGVRDRVCLEHVDDRQAKLAERGEEGLLVRDAASHGEGGAAGLRHDRTGFTWNWPPLGGRFEGLKLILLKTKKQIPASFFGVFLCPPNHYPFAGLPIDNYRT